jgi:hypothetical protein
MRKSFPMRFLVVALWSSSAWAQGIQNTDMFFSAGPAWNASHAIGGTNVTLADSLGYSWQWGFGYQIVRASAAGLWIDWSLVFGTPGALKANVPVLNGSNTSWNADMVGLRFMVPVNSRLSFYAVSDGGAGFFSLPFVTGGANPSVSTYDTVHGVFAFGGGADVRLSQWFSLRAEVKDFVTGNELSGAAGRQHVLAFFGVAFHH